ncbi:hypothetical protein L9F63_004226, partial [Diploptera punctata]
DPSNGPQVISSYDTEDHHRPNNEVRSIIASYTTLNGMCYFVKRIVLHQTLINFKPLTIYLYIGLIKAFNLYNRTLRFNNYTCYDGLEEDFRAVGRGREYCISLSNLFNISS